MPSGAEIRDGLYRVNGSQTMDTEAGDWHEGKWNVDVSFDVYFQGQKASSAAGKMRLTVEREAATPSQEAEPQEGASPQPNGTKQE